jgi:hypothetical protein
LSGSVRALSAAFFAGVLLATSFVFAGRVGEREVHRAVAVRHSSLVEVPEAPRTMIASYNDYSLEGRETATADPTWRDATWTSPLRRTGR